MGPWLFFEGGGGGGEGILIWDTTCPDTLALSHLSTVAREKLMQWRYLQSMEEPELLTPGLLHSLL